MRSLFFDVMRTVNRTIERSTLSISTVLRVLGISRSWYYS
jgi:predicted DNA-binding transcriptional regulator AlpA